MANWFEKWRARLWPRMPRTQPQAETRTQPEAKKDGFAWDAERQDFQLRDAERYRAQREEEVKRVQEATKAEEEEWKRYMGALYPEEERHWNKAIQRAAFILVAWGAALGAAKEFLRVGTLEFLTVCGLALLWSIYRSIRYLTVVIIGFRRGL
jgi:hypothetical protein